MKIGVLLKQVPDTETRLKLVPDGSGIDEATIKWVVNPYDELAVEEALRLKEKAGGEVVIITAGPARAVEAIRTALAMGADRGIRIDTTGMILDTSMTAKILAAVVKEENFNIIFAGKRAIDDDCSQVVQAVSEEIGWASVPVIEKFELNGDKALVQVPSGGGIKEVLEVGLPAVFGCEKDLNKPRYASLPGIMKAKSKPIQDKSAKDLLSGAGIKVETVRYSLPPERAAGRKVEGEADVVAEQLIKYLKEELRII